MLSKEEIQNRIRELDSNIIQQNQYAQQMNNQILMMHGAKEELNALIRRLFSDESNDKKTGEPINTEAPKEDEISTKDNVDL